MANSVNEPPARQFTEHIRREELVHTSRVRRDFPKREAQRRLQKKESKWAPIAYGIFLGAIVVIFCLAYITYAFSKYRGEILPGVKVDTVAVGGLTAKQAAVLINNQEAAIGRSPVRLVYGPYVWEPMPGQIGLTYHPEVTAKEAMNVGRTETFIEQLIDRLPIHPTHEVALAYTVDEARLKAYIQANMGTKLHQPSINAAIVPVLPTQDDFRLRASHDGLDLDFAAAENTVHSILGSLTKQTRTLAVIHTHPAITSTDALRFLARVKRFLGAAPVIGVGKRVFAAPRKPIAQMLSFNDQVGKGRASVVMKVNESAIHAFVATLASQIDRPAQNATFDFSGGKVTVVQPRRTGRTLDQTKAYDDIVRVVSALQPRAKIRLRESVIQPQLDTTNPASLGISTLIGEGTSSFLGAGSRRLADVTAVAKALNNTLITPDQDISFNTLAGTDWLNSMYNDHETSVSGQLVPSDDGAIQQVATTFLRAMYQAGMKVEERHAHPYRLNWYEPPIGLDAIVNPGRNVDLRFANSAHKYLLIETRVEPIRQQLYIYVYGPNLNWKVSVDRLGKVVQTTPHGPAIRRVDPSLAPGEVHQTAWAHDGAVTVVQRTITYSKGRVAADQIDTTYQPWQAIISVGAQPAPTATPSSHKQNATPTPVPAAPSPSATFSH